jgi:hypothetical protein
MNTYELAGSLMFRNKVMGIPGRPPCQALGRQGRPAEGTHAHAQALVRAHTHLLPRKRACCRARAGGIGRARCTGAACGRGQRAGEGGAALASTMPRRVGEGALHLPAWCADVRARAVRPWRTPWPALARYRAQASGCSVGVVGVDSQFELRLNQG